MRSPLGALVRPRNALAGPPPYVGRGLSGRMPWSGRSDTETQMRAMGAVGTLFAIVDRLAGDTSRVVWHLYRSSKSGDPEDRVEVTNHLALDLWNKPNSFFTGQELRETTQQHLDLVGEGWWVISRSPRMRSIPLEIWPVRPDRMFPVPSAEKFLAGYVYMGPDGEQIPLEVDEVIFIRRPNPLDPYRGMGPVQAVLADIDSARYSAEWNRNFFLNSAEPGGVIQAPDGLTDVEFDRLQKQWGEQHQGVGNAHRVAILEKATWATRQFSMRDMQFSELRNVQREIIREAFAFPKSELGTVDQVNRANAEQGSVTLARGHIVPRLERLKGAANFDFLPLFGPTGKGLEFDYENPVPDDDEIANAALTAKTTAYQVLVNTGVDPDDAADVCELPRMKLKVTAPPPAEPPAPPVPPEPTPPVPGPPANRAITAATQQPEQVPQSDLPDLGPVEASWAAALADLLHQWASVLGTWYDALIAAVRRLVAGGDRAGLAVLEIPSADVDEGVTLAAAAAIRLAHEAAHQVVREAADQGVAIEAGTVDEVAVHAAADATVEMLARELAISAGREATRLHVPGTDGEAEAERVADGVRQHLDSLTDARPRQWLGHALTEAQHAGRVATMTAAEHSVPSVAYYGQEQNDRNTCRYCREIDGRWLGNTIGDALRDYPAGGYTRCEGGPRCRGMVAAVYRPKTTSGEAA